MRLLVLNNTSGSNLILDLYFYGDLVSSTGNSGETIAINAGNYTTTQLGNLHTLTTTLTENNTSYTNRKAEVDEIDLIEDTLLQKIEVLSDNNLQLDNDLGTIINSENPVTFAYEWNYNLNNNESIALELDSTIEPAAVPWEFSPSLGLLLVVGFSSFSHWRKKNIQRSHPPLCK